MAKSQENQEAILDELLISIRVKRAEFVNLQKETNRLLDSKIQYFKQIETLHQTIKALSEEKSKIDKKISEANKTYKKQLSDILTREASVSLAEKGTS